MANAAYDLGIPSCIVNASGTWLQQAPPQRGLTPQPNRLVPRCASSIYYAAAAMARTDLYKHLLLPHLRRFWLYAALFHLRKIMANITDQAFGFLLDFSTNATMFHMNNFGNYGGSQTLDRLRRTAVRQVRATFYNENTPILGPRTRSMKLALMRQRANLQQLPPWPGKSPAAARITLHTAQAATIPWRASPSGTMWGVCRSPSSYLAMDASETLLIPGETARIPAAIGDLAVAHSGSDVAPELVGSQCGHPGPAANSRGLPHLCPRQRPSPHPGRSAGRSGPSFTR